MTISEAERQLIEKYRDQLFPSTDGMDYTMRYLQANFNLFEIPVTSTDAQSFRNVWQQVASQHNRTPVFVAYRIPRDTMSESYFQYENQDKNEIVVVLERTFGCIFCTNNRLYLELALKWDLTEEDIQNNSNALRYRVFCMKELESIMNGMETNAGVSAPAGNASMTAVVKLS